MGYRTATLVTLASRRYLAYPINAEFSRRIAQIMQTCRRAAGATVRTVGSTLRLRGSKKPSAGAQISEQIPNPRRSYTMCLAPGCRRRAS